MLKHFKLSWPTYKRLHKRQNVRASEACPLSSRDTEQPHTISLQLQEPWAMAFVQTPGSITSHTACTASSHSPLRRKALPAGGITSTKGMRLKAALGICHTFLKNNCGLDRQNCLKDLMLFTTSLRLPSSPGKKHHQCSPVAQVLCKVKMWRPNQQK